MSCGELSIFHLRHVNVEISLEVRRLTQAQCSLLHFHLIKQVLSFFQPYVPAYHSLMARLEGDGKQAEEGKMLAHIISWNPDLF